MESQSGTRGGEVIPGAIVVDGDATSGDDAVAAVDVVVVVDDGGEIGGDEFAVGCPMIAADAVAVVDAPNRWNSRNQNIHNGIGAATLESIPERNLDARFIQNRSLPKQSHW